MFQTTSPSAARSPLDRFARVGLLTSAAVIYAFTPSVVWAKEEAAEGGVYGPQLDAGSQVQGGIALGIGPVGTSAVQIGPSTRSERTLNRPLIVTAAAAATASSSEDRSSNGAVLASAAAATSASSSQDIEFDSGFLFGKKRQEIPLERFEKGDSVPPGDYLVDVYVNRKWRLRTELRFAEAGSSSRIVPCANAELVSGLTLKEAGLEGALTALQADPDYCFSVDALVTGAISASNLGAFRLDISIPQTELQNLARGSVDPDLWDEGITAGILNYNINASWGKSGGQEQVNVFSGLNFGLNLDGWRIRQNSSVTLNSAGSDTKLKWRNIQAFVQRDITGLRAQFTAGELFTDGQLFDSFGLRGVRLSTDDRMLPQSRQGFAPVVRGVAATNATVEVRQNGALIYQTTVSPGPFEITDLYPTGIGGNLDVIVTEADGSVTSFVVANAALPQLIRPGLSRFTAAIGMLRDTGVEGDIWAGQGSYQHGFTNVLTGSIGVLVSEGYAAGLIGAAFNTPIGAVSTDVTHSSTNVSGGATSSGQRIRVAYSNYFERTGTSINANAFFYTGGNYLGVNEAVRVRAGRQLGEVPLVLPSPGIPQAVFPTQPPSFVGRDRLDQINFNLAQTIGKSGGQLNAAVVVTTLRGQNRSETQYQLAYNNRIGRLNYTISANRVNMVDGRSDNQFLLSVSLPLGGTGRRNAQAVLTSSHNRATGFQQQALVAGTFGERDEFNFGANASYGERAGTFGSVDIGYRGPSTSLGASVSAGDGFTRATVNAMGSVVGHSGGVTFGQHGGDTIGLVRAPGAKGAAVGGAIGTKVDGAGYAIVPFLQPYIMNTVSLDSTGLPLDRELVTTSAQAVPRQGAVVALDYNMVRGQSLFLRLTLPDGEPLPFGSDITNGEGLPVGIVGQAGRAVARVEEGTSDIEAAWTDAEGTEKFCRFSLAEASFAKGVANMRPRETPLICPEILAKVRQEREELRQARLGL